MAKRTFTAKLQGGREIEIPYTPLIVIAGTEVHKLALHQDLLGAWYVSHPSIGYQICPVHGIYKGIRVSSRGISKKEIKQLALADVELVIQRLGSDKFNATIANKLKGV